MYGNIRQWFPKFSPSSGFTVDYSTYQLLFSISRKLNPSYGGSAFRIIRDSDSAQQDIGFSGTDVDTASIASFCSGTTGRIQTVYNQGTAGSDFDVVYYTGTRSIIYQSGALETVNGKPAILGQTNNGYRTASLPIADSKMIQRKILSAVLQTQNGSSLGSIAGEVATPASGNNRKALTSDTSTGRIILDNIVTTFGGGQNHQLLVQATQNQHRQYSYWDCDVSLAPANENSESFWNGVSQQLRGETVTWAANTNFQFYLMRPFVFLGRFQEFALKTVDSSDQSELRALEAEQNAYYGIY